MRVKQVIQSLPKPNRTQPTMQQHKDSSTTDAVFYSIVTVLGVAVTSLCVYGYRKYKDYKNEENEEIEVKEIFEQLLEEIDDPNYQPQQRDSIPEFPFDSSSVEAVIGEDEDPLREHFED